MRLLRLHGCWKRASLRESPVSDVPETPWREYPGAYLEMTVPKRHCAGDRLRHPHAKERSARDEWQ